MEQTLFLIVIVLINFSCTRMLEPPCNIHNFNNEVNACFMTHHLKPTSLVSAFTSNNSSQSYQDLRVLGSTRDTASAMCSQLNPLMLCLKIAIKGCSTVHQLFEKRGYDVEILKNGLEVLCNNLDDYMTKITCYSTQTNSTNCLAKYNTAVDTLLTTSHKFMGNQTGLCSIKVAYLTCTREVMESRCEITAAKLFTKYKCTIMSHRCNMTTSKVCQFQPESQAYLVPVNTDTSYSYDSMADGDVSTLETTDEMHNHDHSSDEEYTHIDGGAVNSYGNDHHNHSKYHNGSGAVSSFWAVMLGTLPWLLVFYLESGVLTV